VVAEGGNSNEKSSYGDYLKNRVLKTKGADSLRGDRLRTSPTYRLVLAAKEDKNSRNAGMVATASQEGRSDGILA